MLRTELLPLLPVSHVADDGGVPLNHGHGLDQLLLLHAGVGGLVVVGGHGWGRSRVGAVGGHWGQWSRHWHRSRGGHHAGDVVEGGQLALQGLLLLLLQPEPLPPPEQGTVLEHGDGLGVEGPVGSLARSGGVPGDLDEAVVEAQVVSQRVLPPGGVGLVVWEPLHDELVNF